MVDPSIHDAESGTTLTDTSPHTRSDAPLKRLLDARAKSDMSSSSSKAVFSPEERKMIAKYWPVDLVAARTPTYVEDPVEFLRILLMDDFTSDIIVCSNGVEKLDLLYEDCFPECVQRAFNASSSVQEFLANMLKEPTIEKYKGRCQYLEIIDGLHHQIEVRRGDNCFKNKIENVQKKCKTLSPEDIALLYVSEFRLAKEEPHYLRKMEKVKTILKKGIKDVLGQCAPYGIYWDRYDEGTFVGGPGSGKSFHVDQVIWANVGKNYRGYKLVAAWPKEKSNLCDKYLDVLFTPPLSSSDEEMLRAAAKIALIRPGDLYFFAGGVPHVTLSIGEELNLTTYESFIGLNRRAVQMFLMGSDEYMGTTIPLFVQALMPECELEDVKDDIVDNLQELAHIILGNKPYFAPRIGPQVDKIWQQTDAFIPTLQRMFVEAVNMLCRDFYFRQELPRRVFEAIYFIEEGFSDALVKRPKIEALENGGK